MELDEQTGDVVLSEHPSAKTWSELFALMRALGVSKDFMAERPMNIPPCERDLFGNAE